MDPYELGKLGERVAEKWMIKQGWAPLAHRFQNGHRDIDLVMIKNSTVVFVEVKTRADMSFGDPISAVNYYKLRNLRRSMWVWIDRFGHPSWEYRIDVISVLIHEKRAKIRHVVNAHVFGGIG
jgi:putative endonuclease